MMIRLFLLFTVVPTLDLFLLLQIGAWLGPTFAFLLVLITGLVGAWLAKREGLGVLRGLAGELGQGVPPGEKLMEGALVVAGGLLLVTPGVLTDLTGFLFILPFSRRRIAPFALAALAKRFQIETPLGAPRPGRAAPTPPPTPFSNPFDD